MDTRVLARVTRELDTISTVTEPTLILNNFCLSTLPEAVLHNGHCQECLKELCLKNNKIQSLPKDILKLRNLQKLYLPANMLEHLPDAVTGLRFLTFMDVSSNFISSVSPSISDMTSLRDLNLGNNNLASLPDDIWLMPSLRSLNVQGNQLKTLSSEIVHCQSLSKLILDCNDLTYLPVQVTKLHALEYLSAAGNMLQCLPNDFSGTMLRTLLVDMNPDISHVPLSLASVSWWGVLGVEGCPVHVKEENLNFLKPLHTCERVPPLIELTARYLHSMFKGTLRGNKLLWLPDKLCSTLQLPSGLSSWLMPSGCCAQGFECPYSKVYFRHHYAMLVSGLFYKKLKVRGVCKPDNLAISVNCCSLQCAKSYFTIS